MRKILTLSGILLMAAGCQRSAQEAPVVLVTLDPGHFHAALVQKSRYEDVARDVYVYAPEGPDVEAHLARVEGYNARPEDPTDWNEIVYRGDDFLEKMVREAPGDIVVISGRNARKTEYIRRSLEAGFHVLGDKPMAIDAAQFEELRRCFETAREKGLLLYDIMTERFEITTRLQRELSRLPAVYGSQLPGTPDNPGVIMASVHNFYKNVSGSALTRPAWFYDVREQGECIVDVMTHLVDLVQWECFPEEAIYPHDVVINASRRWCTPVDPAQFRASTGLDSYPDFLAGDVKDGVLQVLANGEINYSIKGLNARVTALWDYETPEGGDSHFSRMNGSKASLVIRQDGAGGYVPQLYIEPVESADPAYPAAVREAFAPLAEKYPGIALQECGNGWQVIIPDSYRIGHEAHFAQVVRNYLDYLRDGTLPEWEVPCMITKYFITTRAREIGKIE